MCVSHSQWIWRTGICPALLCELLHICMRCEQMKWCETWALAAVAMLITNAFWETGLEIGKWWKTISHICHDGLQNNLTRLKRRLRLRERRKITHNPNSFHLQVQQQWSPKSFCYVMMELNRREDDCRKALFEEIIFEYSVGRIEVILKLRIRYYEAVDNMMVFYRIDGVGWGWLGLAGVYHMLNRSDILSRQ